MNKNLLRDSVTLKIFQGDNSDYSANYAEYMLTTVRAVPHFETTPEMVEKNTVYVYFFPSVSVCTDESGAKVPIPHMKYGDEAVLSLDEEEKKLRVCGVEYRNGIGEASHVRIRLE